MMRWTWLAALLVMGCAGSLRSDVLLASAHAAYPDCDEVEIAERAEGVQQWMVICGERRLFGLRPEQDVARASSRLPDDAPSLVLLDDHSPPIAWSRAQHVEDAVHAWLQPLRVELTMLGMGEQAFLIVEAPQACAADPQVFVGNARHVLGSAPTSSLVGTRTRFVQRLDPATLEALASEPFDLSHCGVRHSLDAPTAEVFRRWAGAHRAGSPLSQP